MGKIIIINGSPRAPKSNSKRYAEIFIREYKGESEYYNITKDNHREIIMKIHEFTDVLFVFPLYADSLPVTMINFLKSLEENPPKNKPTINVIINCGFLEPMQNNVCIEMVRFFAEENGYNFGSHLCIGAGEAILDTPLNFFVKRKIKNFAGAVIKKKYKNFSATMPLTKAIYIKASTGHWIKRGEKNGLTRDDLEIMSYE